MTLEQVSQRAIVREGFQILLRAEAELLLPKDQAKIRDFYERMAHTCMTWAETIYGERLRGEFLTCDSIRERSQVRTQRYRLTMRSPWENERLWAVVCESTMTGEWLPVQKRYHRISHVWNLEEETVIPIEQITELFSMHVEKHALSFRPDGVYPEGSDMVFFRNASDQTSFLECRLPRKKEGNG